MTITYLCEIMISTWKPIQDAMVAYCEKFFHSVNQWRSYESDVVLENRILLVATLCKIFHEDVLSKSVIEYKLESDSDYSDSLLSEYIPQASNDIEAFQIVKQIVSYDYKIFRSVGFYFQENLLKALAGWSPEMLSKSNINTRENLINCALLLFRLPESAGIIRIIRVFSSEECAIVPLLENILQPNEKEQSNHFILYKFLLKTRDNNYVPQLEPPPPKRLIDDDIVDNSQFTNDFDSPRSVHDNIQDDIIHDHNKVNNSYNENITNENVDTSETASKTRSKRVDDSNLSSSSADIISPKSIDIPKVKSRKFDQPEVETSKSRHNEKLNWSDPKSLIGIKVNILISFNFLTIYSFFLFLTYYSIYLFDEGFTIFSNW